MKLFRVLLLLIPLMPSLATQASPIYRVVEIGLIPNTPANMQSQVSGLNNSNQVVGTSFVDRDNGRAILYENGIVYDLGTLGGQYSRAFSINDNGKVVGMSLTPSSIANNPFVWHAFIADRLAMTDIGAIDRHSVARDINNHGVIVGNSEINTASMGINYELRAIKYSSNIISSIGTLSSTSYNYSDAFSINMQGNIIGSSRISASESHAFYYAGVMHDLGTLGGNNSAAFGINNLNQIVGAADNVSSASQAFIYDNGSMSSLGTLGGTISAAYAINNAGTIVGESNFSLSIPGSHAFIHQNGQMSDLNSMLDSSGNGWLLSNAVDINENGVIVGNGLNPFGQARGYMLIPIPEASSMVTVTLFLLLLPVVLKKHK